MIRRLRRVTIVVFLMFLALFMSTTLIQAVFADQLRSDPRNSRTLVQSYQVQRGSISAGDTTLARSVPSDDVYRFTREYPSGQLYAPAVGFSTHTLRNQGIEEAVNRELSGQANSQFFDKVRDRIDNRTPRGADVDLTLDPDIQKTAWDALGDRNGAAVAYNPKTGRILAMVSKPTFDPNQLTGNDQQTVLKRLNALDSDDDQPLANRTIGGDTYPPGSTFKLVVTAAALADDYTPNSTFRNPSVLPAANSDKVIRNVTRTACGSDSRVNLRTALLYSCNIPFAELGVELGATKIQQQAEKFGFGDRISVPQPVTPSRYPKPQDTAQLQYSSFGQQDVRVTPLQMAMVSGGIANDGVVMRPSMIERVRSAEGEQLQRFTAERYRRAMPKDDADTLADMMVRNVSSGEISGARIKGVDVAGKTGTAQTGQSGIAAYDLWFTGFAPAKDPEVAVAVVTENGGHENASLGSNKVAAPIAQKIMKAVLDQ